MQPTYCRESEQQLPARSVLIQAMTRLTASGGHMRVLPESK